MAEQCKRVVIREEIEHYTPAFVEMAKRVHKTQKSETFWDWILEPHPAGTKVFLRGVKECWEFFPAELWK
jgi:hypothetical protein